MPFLFFGFYSVYILDNFVVLTQTFYFVFVLEDIDAKKKKNYCKNFNIQRNKRNKKKKKNNEKTDVLFPENF